MDHENAGFIVCCRTTSQPPPHMLPKKHVYAAPDRCDTAAGVRIMAFFTLAAIWAGLAYGIMISHVEEHAFRMFRAVISLYMTARAGTLTVNCGIGATPLRMLECGVMTNLNNLLSNIALQAAEFMSMVALSKNVFGILCTVFSFGKLGYTTMKCLLSNVVTGVGRSLYDVNNQLFHWICDQYMVVYDAFYLCRRDH